MNHATALPILASLFASAGTAAAPQSRDLNANEEHMHPVFELAQSRPNHLTVPFWTEDRAIGVIFFEFRKGHTLTRVVEYPHAPRHVRTAILALLADQEPTR